MFELHQGDCLEVMKKIKDNSIDMILCDLPYGTTACKWDSVIPFEPLWEQYNRIIKDNGAIVLFGSEPFSTHLRMSQINEYKYDWIWVKSKGLGFQHSKNMPLKRHEIISVFSKGSMGHKSLLGDKRMQYNPQGVVYTDEIGIVDAKKHGANLGARPKQVGKQYKKAKNFPSSVLKFDSEQGLHPTQKPVALLEYLIKTYTNVGETVLDNCMGSGSTGVACVYNGRKFVGIELDENYFNIAKERIEHAKEVFAYTE